MARIVFLVLCFVLSVLCDQKIPHVTYVTLDTKLGRVKGTEMKTETGRVFKAFSGIPFAKPPVDELRFQPPVPADPWGSEELDATKPGSDCPQPSFLSPKQSAQGKEDCLFLNIYTPDTREGAAIPVLVYIHGGGFVMGTGSPYYYGPERFLEHDVILITIQYRIGLLGFLNTEDSEATGNYGMLDQVLALRWIRENIDQFGGDNHRITIFGESAGGASIMYHLVSPLSKGLFDGAIAQSGSALTQWAYQKRPLDWAKKVAAAIDCPTATTKKMVDCFRRKPIEDLVNGNSKLTVTRFMPFFAAPSVDILGKEVFLPQDPLKLLQERKVNVVPVIAGILEHEGYAFYCDMGNVIKVKGDAFFDKPYAGKYFPVIFDVEPDMTTVFNRIKEEYFGDNDCNDPETFELAMTKAVGDIMFDAGIALTVDLLANGGVPVRTYIINYISNSSIAVMFGGTAGKYASHGDELLFQFTSQLSKLADETKGDKQMAKIMSSIWTKFAAGSFDDLVTVDGHGIDWPLYAKQKPVHLLLNTHPSIQEGRLSNKANFWANTIPKLVKDHRVRIEL